MKLVSLAAPVVLAWASLAPAEVDACDPGPIFKIEVKSSDVPACVELVPRRRTPIGTRGAQSDPTRSAMLDIHNRCADELLIDPVSCAACGPSTRIGVATQASFAVETRSQGEAVDYGQTTQQSLRWAVGSQTGTLETEVTVVDDLEACRSSPPDGAGGRVGCSLAGEPAPPAWVAVLALAVFGMRSARRRR